MKQAIKKSICTLLAVVLLLTAVPLAGFAGIDVPAIDFGILAEAAGIIDSGTCGENLTWTLDDEGTLIISGVGDMTNYSFSTSSSPAPWSSYQSSVKTVVITDGVTSIGDHAFGDCYNLVSITLPNDLQSIGTFAFYCCTSLTSITLPNSVTNIGTYTFGYCHSLVSVTLPNDLQSIDRFAFGSCSSLMSVEIPENVTNLDPLAFKSCYKLTSIVTDTNNVNYTSDEYGVLFNKNMTEIVRYPRGNDRTTYIVPDSVMRIGAYAFGDIPNDKGDGPTQGYVAWSLKSITIPDSVTSIDNYAFYGSTALTDVYYTGTESQWKDAFEAYDNNFLLQATVHFNYHPNVTDHDYITSVTAPTCTTQGYTTYTCICGDSYVADYVPAAHTYVDGVCSICGDIAIIASGVCGDNLTWVLNGLGTLTISGTGDMYDYAASYAESSFPLAPWNNHCSFINRVVIADGVTRLGNCAFYDCKALTCVEFGENSQLKNIGESTFGDCTALSYISLPESVTTLEEGAFFACGLQSIDIPSAVTSIGIQAFSNCEALTTCTFAENSTLTIIDSAAFWMCYSLTRFTIPASVTYIDSAAFVFCEALSAIDVEEENSYYSSKNGVLYNKDKTILMAYPSGKTETSFTVPNEVTTIATGAFAYNTTLDTIILPFGVTTIGELAFAAATSLTTIVIPDSMTDIVEFAFESCDSLTDVYYTGTQAEWNAIAIVEDGNEPLLNATIHFNYHPNAEDHHYTSAVTAPTCTEKGFTTYTCSCGDTYITDYTDSKGHDYNVIVTAPTCEKDGFTTYTCTTCGDTFVADYTDALGHAYIGTVTTNPTCTEDGVKTYICSNDATHTYNEAVAKLGHTAGSAVMEDEIEATCTADGSYNMVVYCTTCGEKLSITTYAITATGHSAGAGATCTTDQTCTVCGEVLAEKLGHNYNVVVTAPTCENSGFTTYTCASCGDTYVSNYTDALGHDWGEWDTVSTATCEEDGLAKRICKNNVSHKEEKVLPATGHKAGADATCTEDKSCTVCGEILAEKLGHNYNAVVTAPTCTEQGYTTHTCVCGDSYVSDYTDKIPHKFTKYISDNNADCTSDGTKYAFCDNNCGTKNRIIDEGSKLDHIDENDDGYCDLDGTELYAHHKCMCHNKNAFVRKFFYPIARFFWKLFSIRKNCECGKAHY